jgi:hypothetical protein
LIKQALSEPIRERLEGRFVGNTFYGLTSGTVVGDLSGSFQTGVAFLSAPNDVQRLLDIVVTLPTSAIADVAAYAQLSAMLHEGVAWIERAPTPTRWAPRETFPVLSGDEI